MVFFMIFFNFEVTLCNDLEVSGIDTLHNCICILELLAYKNLASFDLKCARYARTKFARAPILTIFINFDTL